MLFKNTINIYYVLLYVLLIFRDYVEICIPVWTVSLNMLAIFIAPLICTYISDTGV